MPLIVALSLAAATLVAVAPLRAQTVTDTIRVGVIGLFPLGEGVDTIDVEFEMRTPTGAMQKRSLVSVVRRVREQLNGEEVLHLVSGADPAQGSYHFYLDPRTLATRRFEQRTPTDSAVIAVVGDCVTGWVDLRDAPRRTITCDRAADRFLASSPLEEQVVALLPLAPGQSATVATYGIAGMDGYTFRVTGEEVLHLGHHRFDTWRVERTVVSNYGTYTTTLWVDQTRHRVLRSRRDFGNGRVSQSVLRNP